MKNLLPSLLAISLLAGCAHRTTVLNASDDLMRLSRPTKAYVDTFNGKTSQWEASANQVLLPPGLYVGAYKAPPVESPKETRWKQIKYGIIAFGALLLLKFLHPWTWFRRSQTTLK